MDRRKQTAAEQQKYIHQDWPAVYYGPDGQFQTFQSEDELPEGWVDHPSKVGKADNGTVQFKADNIDDDDDDVKWLMDQSNGATVEVLKKTLEEAEVEYLANWPKLKLAKTVVDSDLVDEVKANIED